MPGRREAGRLWLAIHHLAVDGVSWRILVPDLAAAWQAIAAGRRSSLPPRGTSFRDWAERLAAHARGPTALRRSFRSGAGCNASRRCCCRRSARSGSRPCRHGRASDADAAGGGDGCAADAGAGGVPWRHRRRAADRAGAGGGGLVPASCAGRRQLIRRQPRGAARPRRPRPRGGLVFGRRRPDPDGGLVHQPLSGAARSGPARSGGGAVGRTCARPGAEDDQGAAAGGARQGAGLRAAALSQRCDRGGAWRAARRRSSASTIWAGSRPEGRRRLVRLADRTRR